jgi:hypothetical protein
VKRTHGFLIAVVLGAAAVAGTLAMLQTASLGAEAGSASDKEIARADMRLDRQEAKLRRAAKRRPPKLPKVPDATPASAPAASGAPATSSAPAPAPAPARPVPAPAANVPVSSGHGSDDHEDMLEDRADEIEDLADERADAAEDLADEREDALEDRFDD